MNPPIVIVHAAADLRRQALLAEAERDRRTAEPRAHPRRLALRRKMAAAAAWAVAAISRIVDDFEPTPRPGVRMGDAEGRADPGQDGGFRRISQTWTPLSGTSVSARAAKPRRS